MSDASVPLLGGQELIRLATRQAVYAMPCQACAAIASAGWQSIPGGFDRKVLRRAGTLRRPEDEDPTLREHHPAGTNAWSPEAPIAVAFFPYNRCDVWECATCLLPFLRYTEYGGYYEEERIRPVDPQLVCDGP